MKTKLLRLWLTALMLLVTTASYAYDACIDGIYYYFSGSNATVTYLYYNSLDNSEAYSGDVVIPSTVDYKGSTYKVTSIGNFAFYNCSTLSSITIPNSVISIGDRAFQYCSTLSSITIPNSVTSIGERTFYGCRALVSITIPHSVTSIGTSAFASCSHLASINIPKSVTSIGDNAFEYCSSLTAVNISDLAAWCNINFTGQDSNPLNLAHHLYVNGKEIVELVIPESVAEIKPYAFCGCSSITSITIPESITTIGRGAFEYCSSITSITIPESITSIGVFAFYECM